MGWSAAHASAGNPPPAHPQARRDVGSHETGPHAGQGLIAATGGQTPLLLELKNPLLLQEKYGRILIEHAGAGRRADPFGPGLVSFRLCGRGAAESRPAIPIGHVTCRTRQPEASVKLLGPVWPLIYLNPTYVALAHRMGSIVAPLDPNPIPRLPYYMGLQVDAVLADKPGRTLQRILDILRE